MIRLASFLKAIVAASAVTPLLFYLSLLIASRLVGNAGAVLNDLDGAGGHLIMPILALYYGLLIALVLNLVVMLLMSAAGRRFDRAKHPLAWAVAGAVSAVACTAALGMFVVLPEFALAFIVSGAGAAVAGRLFLRWEPPEAQA